MAIIIGSGTLHPTGRRTDSCKAISQSSSPHDTVRMLELHSATMKGKKLKTGTLNVIIQR
jgi:hypothetical protein